MKEEDVKILMEKYKVIEIIKDGQTICMKNINYEKLKGIKNNIKEVIFNGK